MFGAGPADEHATADHASRRGAANADSRSRGHGCTAGEDCPDRGKRDASTTRAACTEDPKYCDAREHDT
jgi:hypothetical protein